MAHRQLGYIGALTDKKNGIMQERMNKEESGMTFIRKLAFFLLPGILSGCYADEPACHLSESAAGGIIYKTCGNDIKEINFDYDVFVVRLSDDVTNSELAILIQTPKTSDMSDERYFIFDYKNMIVYDNKCLGGNFIMLDSDQNIVFEKYGTTVDIAFSPRDYSHCKQPLQTWVETQQKW